MKIEYCKYCKENGCIECSYMGFFLIAYNRSFTYPKEQRFKEVPRIRFRIYHKPHFININLVHSDGYLEHVANIPIL